MSIAIQRDNAQMLRQVRPLLMIFRFQDFVFGVSVHQHAG
jgi:hypothetical protein